ncbi:MAG: hypothetical protein FWH53_00110 [Leptospirales bacterium]|nr:hypothetical protein [Leptospirales bacterium]
MAEEINDTEVAEVQVTRRNRHPERSVAAQAEEKAEEKTEEKTWDEWVKEFGINRALAKGACSEAKLDWDATITKSFFENTVRNFGKKGHGRKK